MKVIFEGIRIGDHADYPFEDFLLEEIGFGEKVLKEWGDGNEAESQKKKKRTVLWMGFANERRTIIAGMLVSEPKSRSYATVTTDGERTVIKLAEVDKYAKDLNFFVYSAELKAMLYQSKHFSIGPNGFLTLLSPDYKAARTRAAKESRRKEVDAEHGLGCTLISTRSSLEEAILEFGSGTIIAVEGKDVLQDGAPPSVKRREHRWSFCADGGEEHGIMAWLQGMRPGYKKVKLRGKKRTGQSKTLDIDDLRSKLAFLEMEQDDWMALLAEAGFRREDFPYDSVSNRLLKPIEKLIEILDENRAVLQKV